MEDPEKTLALINFYINEVQRIVHAVYFLM